MCEREAEVRKNEKKKKVLSHKPRKKITSKMKE
jgi:hypothetical protein